MFCKRTTQAAGKPRRQPRQDCGGREPFKHHRYVSRTRRLEAKLTMSMRLLIQAWRGHAARACRPQAAADAAERYLIAPHRRLHLPGMPSDTSTSGIRAGHPCRPDISADACPAAGQGTAAQRRRPASCPGAGREPAAAGLQGRGPRRGKRARPGAGGTGVGSAGADWRPGPEDLLTPAELTGPARPAKVPAGCTRPDEGGRPARSGHLPPPSLLLRRARLAGCGTAKRAGASCPPRLVPALPRHEPRARAGPGPVRELSRPWTVVP
jgi:hypothetical protein